MLALLALAVGFQGRGLPFTPGARYSDAVTAHYPAALHMQRQAAVGQFPIWREIFFAGQPFAANPLNKTAYPPQWAAFVLPPLLHLNLMIIAHGVLAAIGMWRWARAEGLTQAGATLAAIGWALSPRLLAHTGGGHLDIVYALAWLPWLMAGVRALAEADRPAHASLLRLGCVAALIALADVRVSLFAFALALGYGLVRYRASRLSLRRAVARVSLSGLVAAVATVSLTVPLIAWGPHLTRAALTPAEAGAFSLQASHFIGLLVMPPPSSGLETLTYVGLPILLLAGVALLRAPRRHAFWIGALVLAGVYALGVNGGLWALLTALFPPLLWFRVPARAWLIAAFILPFLAGHGLDLIAAAARRRRVNAVHLIAGVAFTVAGGYIGVSGLLGGASAVGLVGGGLLLLIALSGARPMTPRAVTLAALALVLADLLAFAHTWAEWRPLEAWLSPRQRAIGEHLAALEGVGRVYTPNYAIEVQTAAEYNLELFGGVDPFQVAEVTGAIQQAGGIEFSGYSVVQPPLLGASGDDVEAANRDAVPDAALLGRWGVTHVLAAAPLAAQADGLFLIGQIDDGPFLYENRNRALSSPVQPPVPNWPPDLVLAGQVPTLNALTQAAAVAGMAVWGSAVLAWIALSRRALTRKVRVN